MEITRKNIIKANAAFFYHRKGSTAPVLHFGFKEKRVTVPVTHFSCQEKRVMLPVTRFSCQEKRVTGAVTRFSLKPKCDTEVVERFSLVKNAALAFIRCFLMDAMSESINSTNFVKHAFHRRITRNTSILVHDMQLRKLGEHGVHDTDAMN